MHFVKEHRHIFGAYFNMGLQNAYIICKEIAMKIKINGPEEIQLSDFIDKIKSEGKEKPEILQKATELFEKHFRFLKPMTDFKKKDKEFTGDISDVYFEKLKKIFDDLVNCRNFYTHTQHKDFELKLHIADLQRAFVDSVTSIKERFKLEQQQIEHLWLYDNKGKKKKMFYYDFFDNDGKNISEKGLEFFACLFLEKRYAYNFLKQFRGFKSSKNEKEKATLESFCYFCIKLPKERIETIDDKFSLSLDMLNELQKCPGILFRQICKQDQEKFRTSLYNDTDYGSVNAIIPDGDDTEEKEKLLIRKADRFPVFALKYLDYNEIFKKLRFHIDLGTYNFNFYNKTSIDGTKRTRILNKRMKGFGRLGEVTSKRLELWNEQIRKKEAFEIDHENTKPYITDTTPHYHIVNNKIGLKNCNNEGMYIPELCNRHSKLAKPDYFLSLFELPALIFYNHLCYEYQVLNKTAEDIILDYKEELIFKFKERITKFMEDISQGYLKQYTDINQLSAKLKQDYELDIKIIPKELRNYLLGKESGNYKKYAQSKISNMIEETQKLIQQFKNKKERVQDKRNKPGKKGYTEIKSGELAEFLAKDMLKFQGFAAEAKKGKVNSQDFQVLQAGLAMFALKRDSLEEIFRKAGLIDSENPHPFLKSISDTSQSNYKDFYIKYLEKRLEYLEKCSKLKIYDEYHYLKPQRIKWSERNSEYIKKLIDRYKEIPVNLPRGLFLDAIIGWIKQNDNKIRGLNNRLRDNTRMNTNFLIQKYFELVIEDSNQEFYDYKRHYELINKLYDTRGAKDKFKKLPEHYFSQDELQKKLKEIKQSVSNMNENSDDKKSKKVKFKKLLNNFTKNEKLIRLYKVQDMLTFIMGKEILFSSSPTVESQIKMDKEFKMKDIKPINSMKPGTDSNNILSKQINYEHKFKGGYTVCATLKIKNFGDFIGLLHDKRIESLFKLFPQNLKVDKKELEKELQNFENSRIEVFEIIHRLENVTYRRCKSILKMNDDGYIEFKRYIDALKNLFPDKIDALETINIIRNKFSHNQYPDISCFSEHTVPVLPNVSVGLLKNLKDKSGFFIERLKE